MTVKSPTMKIKSNKFIGDGQDFSDFYLHFETVSEMNEWENAHKLQVLISRMDGSALEYSTGFNWKTQTYSSIVEKLRSRFDCYSLETVSKSHFSSYKKNKSISWMEVVHQLQMLASKAYKEYDDDEKAYDDMLCKKIIDLVTDCYLKKQLAWLDIKNPQLLCERKMIWESITHGVQTSSEKDK